MKGLGLIRVVVDGGEQLTSPTTRLGIANHPTLIDYVILVSMLPQAVSVVKKASGSNPFIAVVGIQTLQDAVALLSGERPRRSG